LRHEHVLFRGSYIEQQFLSFLWQEIHSAPIVDIRGVHDKRRIAGYLASYVAKSPSGRYSYSWGWVWRGLAHTWLVYKQMCWHIGLLPYGDYLTHWRKLVRLRERPLEVGTWLRQSIMSGLGAVNVAGVLGLQLELKL